MNTPVHLTIMQPPGYVHSQGFLDQARYLRYQFRRLGCDVSIGKNRLKANSINIIFGSHLGFPSELKERFTCVFFNLEQLLGGASVGENYLNLLKKSAIIDYEPANLSVYGCKDGDVPIVLFSGAPYLYPVESMPIEDRPIDILFFGVISQRRKLWIDKIEACGWKVTTFEKPLYGDERDYFVKRSKSVLNCHFHDNGGFEQARAFPALSLGTPVLSEWTPATNPPEIYKNIVSWFDENTLEDFFLNEFMTEKWTSEFNLNLNKFMMNQDFGSWQVAFNFCQSFHQLNMQSIEGGNDWNPEIMNLGSGANYEIGILNVDLNPNSEPDLIFDLSQNIKLPVRIDQQDGSRISLCNGQFSLVKSRNYLQSVADLHTLMGNVLDLLKIDGIFQIEVPYEGSIGAWVDCQAVRTMNKYSWGIFTDKFWSLGRFYYRFELVDIQWRDSHGQACEESYSASMIVKLRKVETTFYERSIARSMQSDFGGIANDI